MTEEQAKTKVCCGPPMLAAAAFLAGMSRGAQLEAISAFGEQLGSPPSNCRASACMAWRWNEPWTSQTEEGHGGDLVLRLKRKAGEPKLGFCGLAGSPQ